MNRGYYYLTLLISLIILFPSPVSAHRVNVFAYVEDGRVYVEGYFMDGRGAGNSEVQVFDAHSGERLLTLRTDRDGKASFNIPKKTPLRIVLNAGTGHVNDYLLKMEEIDTATDDSKEKEEAFIEREDGDIIHQRDEPCSKDITMIIDRELQKRLRPIQEMLIRIEKSSTRPGITEIMGGIGYIVGIAGILMYFKSRKR